MKKMFFAALVSICISNTAFAATGFQKIAGGGTDTVPNVGDLATNLLIDSYASKVDSDGNFYVATYPDALDNVGFIRINREGVVDRVFVDPIHLRMWFDDIDVDRSGNVYLYGDQVITKVDANDGMTELATGIKTDCLAVDPGGNVYSTGYHDTRFWKIDAGTQTANVIYNSTDPNFSTYACATDGAGNVYAGYNNELFRVYYNGVSWESTPIAGNGLPGPTANGVLATDTSIYYPDGIDADQWGNVYFVSYENATNSYLLKIDTSGIISTLGTSVPVTSSGIGDPVRLSVDDEGMLYIHVYSNNAKSEIQKYTFAPEIHTITPADSSVGENITISGRYFLNDGVGGSVTIDGTVAEVIFWSNEKIIVTIPSGAKGFVPVMVTTKDGDSVPAAFNYRVK